MLVIDLYFIKCRQFKRYILVRDLDPSYPVTNASNFWPISLIVLKFHLKSSVLKILISVGIN